MVSPLRNGHVSFRNVTKHVPQANGQMGVNLICCSLNGDMGCITKL